MKHVVYRLLYSYEKEEKWLNDMANKGLNFVHYSIGKYLFEEGRPGEYIYRIEFLKHSASHPESMAYIRFMEDMGIECVSTYISWVYFRKKAADGPFELFSDNDSKIAHCSRVAAFTCFGFTFNLFIAFFNIFVSFIAHNYINFINLFCGFLNLTIGLILASLFVSYRSRIKKMKADRQVRE